MALSTPLDGSLEVTVPLPRNGLQDVVLVDNARKTAVATALWSSRGRKRITATICGQRSLTLHVTQNGAPGRVVISTTLP